MFAGEQDIRPGEYVAELIEHVVVEDVGADVAFRAASGFAAGADGVVVAAVVVPVPGAVSAAHLVAVDADAAAAAFDQAAQQPLAWLGAARAPLAVVVADPPGRLEYVLADQGGYLDRYPFLAGPRHLPGLVSWPGVGDGLGLVEVHPADVGLVAEEPAQRGRSPARLSGRGGHGFGGEGDGDLSHGEPGVDTVGEDAADHRGFRFEDFQPGRASRVAGEPAVAVGNAPGQHLTGAGAEQFAAPIPLGDLRAFVFGDDPLDLGEELGLRVVIEGGGVGEAHVDAVPGQFVEHDHLVGVHAGEPVRGQAPDTVEQTCFGGVAQRVQAGPVQSGAGMPVVAEFGDEFVTGRADPVAQHGELAADRAAFLLPFRGYSRVDRDSHRAPSRASSSRAEYAASSRTANPAARASSRGSACGLHAGRGAPTTLAEYTGSALGHLIRPARPRRVNLPAASEDGTCRSPSTARRRVS